MSKFVLALTCILPFCSSAFADPGFRDVIPEAEVKAYGPYRPGDRMPLFGNMICQTEAAIDGIHSAGAKSFRMGAMTWQIMSMLPTCHMLPPEPPIIVTLIEIGDVYALVDQDEKGRSPYYKIKVRLGEIDFWVSIHYDYIEGQGIWAPKEI